MIASQNIRYVALVRPGAIVDNTSWTSQTVDTLASGVKYNAVTMVFQFGASDIAMAALKVQSSDDDTNWDEIDGADFSVSPATLPSATDDFKFFGVEVKDASQRYYRCVATAGDGTAGTYLSGFAALSRATQTPNTTAERGFEQLLTV